MWSTLNCALMVLVFCVSAVHAVASEEEHRCDVEPHFHRSGEKSRITDTERRVLGIYPAQDRIHEDGSTDLLKRPVKPPLTTAAPAPSQCEDKLKYLVENLQSIIDTCSSLICCGEPTPEPEPTPAVCADYCSWPDDEECDDGGPGSSHHVCPYGSDCSDCGPRPVSMVCNDVCDWAYDGACDDGGQDSSYNVCTFGTDCGDCGPRRVFCTDDCHAANDGLCDDGGHGHNGANACSHGTDCGDCGSRSADAICWNSCGSSYDGVCDDGGPDNGLCIYGTDCADCGTRYMP
ncbi:uncharacterized protein LOC102810084 [Saccoglossus kowalevskii]|uniref:Low-density lipoprotein receptor-related protein 1-like n=1 Tax=Saccoglossus kowalevskii TaxID=10224 RepID=A0ABM0LZ88_SACKO|nr:PREDICTED: low-density lipoprotein receptor-related protein 1-like [Saccoglossus kowalevskii]